METRIETSELKQVISENKKKIDRMILDFLPKNHKTIEISSLYEMMRDYPGRGGKGLRGTLCLLWCSLFGGTKEDAIVSAAALELFQNWILIHDDIEDQSDLRRGLPALHKKYGIELSINAGDALHARMWELLLQNVGVVGQDRSLRILSEFCTMINETTEGQHMELSWTLGNRWNITEQDYFTMVTKKAAWYTCITPARVGVILSRNSSTHSRVKNESSILNEIVAFGTDLGISFQIIDDVLNLTADQSKYGKELLGDLYEGKRTLMLIHLLRESGEKRRADVITKISKKRQEKSEEEVREILDLMKDLGSIEYAKRIAADHSKMALELFDSMVEVYSKDQLQSRTYWTVRSLLEYLTNRDY